MRKIWARGWRFAVTGVLSNVTLYMVFLLLLWAGVYYPLALTIVYILGMMWGYFVNRLWSWRDNSPVLRSAAAYIVVYLGVYLAHISFVALLVEWAKHPAAFAAIISFVCLTIPLFFLLNQIVYRHPMDRT